MRSALGVLGAGALVVTSCGARSSLERTIHGAPANPEVVRACMMLYACGGPSGLFEPSPNTISNCIYGALGPASLLEGAPTISTGLFQTTSAACLATATDCSAARTCMFGSAIACLGASAPVYCAREHAVHCTPLGPSGDDCAAAGFLRDADAHCMTSTTGNVQCAFAACDPKTTAACDGNVSQHCTDGLLERWTCPAGTTCGEGTKPQQLGCVGAGAPCSTDRCDDDGALEACLAGREFRLDCGALPIPSRCSSTNGCRPSPDLSCDPTKFIDACDGSSVVYCDGDRRSFDCTTIGFTKCGTLKGAAACE